jgi:hypothetical protein
MSTLAQRTDSLITNIKVLSKLEPSQRPLFKNHDVTIRNHYPVITGLVRRIANEGRDDVITGLESLIHEITKLIEDYKNSVELSSIPNSAYDCEIANPLLNALNRIGQEIPHLYDTDNKGLQAIQSTYIGDATVTSKLERLIDNFKLTARTLNHELCKLTEKFTMRSSDANTIKP